MNDTPGTETDEADAIVESVMDDQGEEVSDTDADWGAALEEQEREEQAGGSQTGGLQVDQVDMEDLVDSGTGPTMEDANLDVILDIPVTISMEVGSSKISIRNLLKLNQGSVVELERLAGEPLDVMVNGTLIAHGEVVVVNEKYGIRLTDVISAAERINKLQ